jgi:hypothetical protein
VQATLCQGSTPRGQPAGVNSLSELSGKGTRLQDEVLWDVEKRDIVECPVCHNQSTMRLDDIQTINAYNQGARDAATAKGGNRTFTTKKPRHGCYAFMLSCNGRHDNGNCLECVWRVCNQERPTIMYGPGKCPFL